LRHSRSRAAVTGRGFFVGAALAGVQGIWRQRLAEPGQPVLDHLDPEPPKRLLDGGQQHATVLPLVE